MLPIVKYPNQFLSQVCAPVLLFNTDLKELCEDMHITMKSAGGIGLAANQVGRTLRVLVVNIADTPYTLVNPVITYEEGKQEMKEGCLSFPGLRVRVTRAQQIKVDFQDELGNNQHIDAEGLLSICIQHEVDHLNGITFIDKFSALKRSLYLKKYIKRKVY